MTSFIFSFVLLSGDINLINIWNCWSLPMGNQMKWSSILIYCTWLCFVSFVGLDWGEVRSRVAFHRPFTGLLCWASIFSDDRQAYLYSWSWCCRISGDRGMASKSIKFYPLNAWPPIFFLSHSQICLFAHSVSNFM